MNFQTTHKLPFLSRPWQRDKNIQEFKIGTCRGQWFAHDLCYVIVSILNETPGNGHLNDVFEWFEHFCKRDGKSLVIIEFFNEQFKTHCIEKRGFIEMGNNVVKIF